MIWIHLLGGLVLINSAYYLLFIRYTVGRQTEAKSANNYPVTVIVCAKNEAENLKAHIPLWLEQDYPEFELVLIDDASFDGTKDVIESFVRQDPRVVMVSVTNNEAFWSNKKYSLTLGIKKASHMRLLFTDADCKPAGKDWLRLMTAGLDNEKSLILGYGAYQRLPGLLNTLIRYETLLTALQYFSYAKAGIPYMGVGRNLAYTSKLFFEQSGFMSHMSIRSGDDDLFVNQAATAKNTLVQDNPDAFSISIPKTSWKAWTTQKRRHITTAKHYKAKHKMLLGLYFVAKIGFWVVAILALLLADWQIALGLIGFRILLQHISLAMGARRLKEKGIWPWALFLELFLVSFQLVIYLSNAFSKPKSWK